MAISIKEEGQSSNLIPIAIYSVVVLGLLGGVYYVFFAAPSNVEIVLPAQLKKTTQIADIKVDSSILNTESYKKLGEKTAVIPEGQFGKENPFSQF